MNNLLLPDIVYVQSFGKVSLMKMGHSLKDWNTLLRKIATAPKAIASLRQNKEWIPSAK